jgi:hypothetical protein
VGKRRLTCWEFGLFNSTVQTTWKNRDKIISAFEQNGSRIERLRKPERSDVDKELLKWFKQQRSENVPVSGPLLMVRAEERAKLLSDEEFVCNARWLDKFKLRHNISCGKVSCEARAVDCETTVERISTVWPKMREGYPDNDIFNADETGLFFGLTPERTLKFKGEKCVGGKLSKDHVTVLVCANADGTKKRKLFVTGKSKNTRCLKNVKKACQFGTAQTKNLGCPPICLKLSCDIGIGKCD